MKFTTKRPRYSGTYIVKDNTYGYAILELFYDQITRTWTVTDYPRCRVTSSLEEYEGIEWGPRLP